MVCSINGREKKDLVNRTMYTIASDIRYNIAFYEVCNKLISGDKYYSISSTTIKDLKNNDVFKLDKSEDVRNYIKLSLVSLNEISIVIRVEINYDGISLCENVLKSRWMDEV